MKKDYAWRSPFKMGKIKRALGNQVLFYVSQNLNLED